MKLIIPIVHKDDASDLQSHLSKAGFMSTKLSTTGGFLRAGNVTLLIGTEDDKVDTVLEILRTCCSRRTEIVTTGGGSYSDSYFASLPVEVTVGGATVFILDVERFIKM
jgi:uncharacterized protein YaaQ